MRAGLLSAVYHGETGIRTLKELSRSYLTINKDLTRVMNRLKALYRSWAIPCAGTTVYAPRHRSEWLSKITEAGVRRRAELFYQQLDALQALRQEVRRDLLARAGNIAATKLLRQIPCIGPIRAALLIALMQTPIGSARKRQLWAYSGLAIGDAQQCGIPLPWKANYNVPRNPWRSAVSIDNHNHDLKYIFKGAATKASSCAGSLPRFLRGFTRQRNEAFDGSSHLGTQDCNHHFDGLEERSAFRRRTSETASSLSVSAESPFHPGDHSWWCAVGFLRRSGSRESIHTHVRPCVPSGTESPDHPMPPRTTQESYRPRVSDRTMVGNSATVTLASFANRRAPSRQRKWNHRGENFAASRDGAKDDRKSEECEFNLGLDAETNELPAPSQRIAIALDIPFYRTTAFMASWPQQAAQMWAT